MREAAARARAAGATLIASGTGAHEIADAEHYLPVPAPPLPLLTPLLSVAPGQLLAWALAQAKGPRPRPPERPRARSRSRSSATGQYHSGHCGS